MMLRIVSRRDFEWMRTYERVSPEKGPKISCNSMRWTPAGSAGLSH